MTHGVTQLPTGDGGALTLHKETPAKPTEEGRRRTLLKKKREAM